jgi:trehalose-6-phosphate synthase
VDSFAEKGSEIVWIGHNAKELFHSSDIVESEKDDNISPYPNLKIVPVALRDSVTLANFRSFSKGVLWPLFHYYGSVKSYSRETWQGYCDVNVDFAKAILKEYQLGDLIFIQDYHLLMVPKYLRELLPHAKIGYFLHTPFPR